jgi:hypothetical protein
LFPCSGTEAHAERPTRRDALCPAAAGDAEQLAALVYHDYLGAIDYEGEDEAQALAELRRTFSGDYGPFI